MVQGIVRDFESMYEEDLKSLSGKLKEAQAKSDKLQSEGAGDIKSAFLNPGSDILKEFEFISVSNEIKDIKSKISDTKSEQKQLNEFKKNEGF